MPKPPQVHRLIDSGYAGISAILIVAAVLRLWNLGQSGFGTQYYAAGVLSMLQSWHNFFFNSFDPAGFVSIDKPPLAFWIQSASAKILGFNAFSIRLPQVLEGIAVIAMLYHLVRRHFGIAAAQLAAFFAAIMPISVAVDRSNNTDSCLAMLLVVAGWAMSLAVERSSYRMLFFAMGLLGIAFNVKMLAALVVVPGFMAVYWLGTPLPVTRKISHLLLSFAILIVVSLLWCVLYDLTPASLRPYAGSTADNSMLELVVGENGARRFVRGAGQGGRGPIAQNVTQSPVATPLNPASQGVAGRGRGGRGGRGRRGGRGGGRGNFAGGRGGDNVPVGPLRLFDPTLADQAGWLYPLAFLGAAAGLSRRRLSLPLTPEESAVFLWTGWALVYGIVLSAAGGIFHAYYVNAMVPPLCALAAIGAVQAWEWRRAAGWRAIVLPVSLMSVLAWQLYVSYGYFQRLPANIQPGFAALAGSGGLQVGLAAFCLVALLAAIGLFYLAGKRTRVGSVFSAAVLILGLLAISLTPAAWAIGSLQSGGGNNPSAAPPRFAAPGATGFGARNNSNNDSRLIAFLLAHTSHEEFFLATLNSQAAAPIILATGKPVMAMGGFAGSDPILTPQRLGEMVDQKQLRFALLGNGPGGGGRGGNVQAPLIAWIRQHGVPVDPSLWRPVQNRQNRPLRRTPAYGARGARLRQPARFAGADAMQLIDLRPDDQGPDAARPNP